MIFFVFSLVVFYFLARSLMESRGGEKNGKLALVLSMTCFTIGFVVLAIGDYIYESKWANTYSWFVLVFAVLTRLFVPYLWAYLDAKEKTALVGKILVETWYHSAPSNYWYRRSEVIPLSEWATKNGKGIGSFELVTLRKYQKYHWIYLEDTAEELPQPQANHNQMIMGRLYGPHEKGPYCRLDL